MTTIEISQRFMCTISLHTISTKLEHIVSTNSLKSPHTVTLFTNTETTIVTNAQMFYCYCWIDIVHPAQLHRPATRCATMHDRSHPSDQTTPQWNSYGRYQGNYCSSNSLRSTAEKCIGCTCTLSLS